MPIRFQKEYQNHAHVLVWEVNETENELLGMLPSTLLTDAELLECKIPHKRLEMLASRLSIRALCQKLEIDFDGIKKDIHGKPYLVNSDWQMSITHSKSFMGVVLHPSQCVGIDIERPQSKMWRIAKRIFSSTELAMIGDDLETLSIFWSIKEALYKLYGRRGTDFRKNLLIERNGMNWVGAIQMPDHQSHHEIMVEQLEEYLMVIAV